MELNEALREICDELAVDIAAEVQHLKDIGGPSGQRNSTASALGLARNSIREALLVKLCALLAEEN